MEFIIGERAGKLVVEKTPSFLGSNIQLVLSYGEVPGPLDQRIPLFPEELDKLCEWWAKEKK